MDKANSSITENKTTVKSNQFLGGEDFSILKL